TDTSGEPDDGAILFLEDADETATPLTGDTSLASTAMTGLIQGVHEVKFTNNRRKPIDLINPTITTNQFVVFYRNGDVNQKVPIYDTNHC
ncbi:MAG: hypothetical protein GTO41_01880, partial [Burkholderiales bacterium]|nr:hypothetical protein [Burkholderiales bacterium]